MLTISLIIIESILILYSLKVLINIRSAVCTRTKEDRDSLFKKVENLYDIIKAIENYTMTTEFYLEEIKKYHKDILNNYNRP